MGRVNHSKGATRQRAHFFDGRNPARYEPEPRRNIHPCHRCGTVTMTRAPDPDDPKEPWLWTCGICVEVLTGRRAAQ